MPVTRIVLPESGIITTRRGGGEILIAATNILFGRIKDDKGNEQRGWTAALTMRVKNRRESQKAFKVNVGQTVRYEKIIVQILDIDRCRNGMYVDAVIRSAE